MSPENSTQEDQETSEEWNELIHNFGELNPIPVGAVALCGEVSTRNGPGEINPLRVRCCPICLALTEQNQ